MKVERKMLVLVGRMKLGKLSGCRCMLGWGMLKGQIKTAIVANNVLFMIL